MRLGRERLKGKGDKHKDRKELPQTRTRYQYTKRMFQKEGTKSAVSRIRYFFAREEQRVRREFPQTGSQGCSTVHEENALEGGDQE